MRVIILVSCLLPLICFSQTTGTPIDSLLHKKFIVGTTIEKDFYTQQDISYKYGEVWEVYYIMLPASSHDHTSILLRNNRGNTLEMWNTIDEKVMTVDSFKNMEKKFGRVNLDRIINPKVWIGMTKEMAKLSWGEPSDINKTITAEAVREQWVYGSGSYLYFTNNKLTTIQN